MTGIPITNASFMLMTSGGYSWSSVVTVSFITALALAKLARNPFCEHSLRDK
jgi:hypothetical protein